MIKDNNSYYKIKSLWESLNSRAEASKKNIDTPGSFKNNIFRSNINETKFQKGVHQTN